ncbi:type II toxin-antitoxin system prevent-host-death family antitoxin [Carboxydochorda subterranea]|uniref:Antitoxin n=1 Tax=Carboxydichorda subterranea TaxID=3109565 RepID=A0ABZ1BUG5_9FIRM|nr:type II toxin-antitoxin system prevent-host-death family antitoxin [Limnochorda sp. L945t]WRP16233.1 type II toxin-antitoxin system prevent-host-death family antitoxin [Limnochorda sp. L945t]
MKVVYVSTLKARLSEFLRLVRSGETVLVTERGRPVAMLTPVTENPPLGEDPRLQALVEYGLIRPPRAPLGVDFLDRPRPADPEGRLLEALLQERAEAR